LTKIEFQDLEQPGKTPEAMDILKAYKQEAFTKDGTPLYFTKENITEKYGGVDLKQKADHFERLSQMYTKEQVRKSEAEKLCVFLIAKFYVFYQSNFLIAKIPYTVNSI
jgi:hypothetical protein